MWLAHARAACCCCCFKPKRRSGQMQASAAARAASSGGGTRRRRRGRSCGRRRSRRSMSWSARLATKGCLLCWTASLATPAWHRRPGMPAWACTAAVARQPQRQRAAAAWEAPVGRATYLAAAVRLRRVAALPARSRPRPRWVRQAAGPLHFACYCGVGHQDPPLLVCQTASKTSCTGRCMLPRSSHHAGGGPAGAGAACRRAGPASAEGAAPGRDGWAQQAGQGHAAADRARAAGGTRAAGGRGGAARGQQQGDP